jgi:putative transcriptional regulator
MIGMIDLRPNQNQIPEKGCVLLSEPFLNDPFFKRTVILLCEHNEEGSFGFVLNNYIDVSLEEVIDQFPNWENVISIGGPVKNGNLFYLHSLGDLIPNSAKVMDGLYFGGDFDAIKASMISGEIKENQIRFFIGYSGWSAQQLEEEIKQQSWYITHVSSKVIMNTGDKDLWKSIMKKFGPKGKMIANLPEDPELN